MELETVVDAVVRETLEETGLVVDAADVRPTVPTHEPASFWASRRHLLGTTHAHGPVGWLAPVLPQ